MNTDPVTVETRTTGVVFIAANLLGAGFCFYDGWPRLGALSLAVAAAIGVFLWRDR